MWMIGDSMGRLGLCNQCNFQSNGKCRKNPPVVVTDRKGNIKTEWPGVQYDDWCGKWKPIA